MQSSSGPSVQAAMRLLLGLSLLSTVAAAAPSVETKKVSDFHEVSVSGGFELTVGQGPAGLRLEGAPDALADVRASVVDGRLVLERKSRAGSWKGRPIIVRATTSLVSRLSASGGCSVTVEAPVAARDLALEVSGGVVLQATGLDLDALRVEASGGVRARLAGKTTRAAFDLSGGVELKAGTLSVSEATIDASGGCRADLLVTTAISGEASGGVQLIVRGHPKSMRIERAGASTVTTL